jgi:hypothetical protein
MRAKIVEPWQCCVYLYVFRGIGWNTVGAKMECVHRCVYLSRFIGIALNPAYARKDGEAFALLRACLCFPWHWMEYRGREGGGVIASMSVSQQVYRHRIESCECARR